MSLPVSRATPDEEQSGVPECEGDKTRGSEHPTIEHHARHEPQKQLNHETEHEGAIHGCVERPVKTLWCSGLAGFGPCPQSQQGEAARPKTGSRSQGEGGHQRDRAPAGDAKLARNHGLQRLPGEQAEERGQESAHNNRCNSVRLPAENKTAQDWAPESLALYWPLLPPPIIVFVSPGIKILRPRLLPVCCSTSGYGKSCNRRSPTITTSSSPVSGVPRPTSGAACRGAVCRPAHWALTFPALSAEWRVGAAPFMRLR